MSAGSFQVAEAHKFDRVTARQRLKDLIPQLRAEYGVLISDVTYEWHGEDSLSYSIVGVRGGTVRGKVVLGDTVAVIEVTYDVPRLVPKFWIEQTVRAALKRTLA